MPLLAVPMWSLTGDELFDAFFSLVAFFGVLALTVGAVMSLFRLLGIAVAVVGLVACAGIVEATTFSADCGDNGATFTLSSAAAVSVAVSYVKDGVTHTAGQLVFQAGDAFTMPCGADTVTFSDSPTNLALSNYGLAVMPHSDGRAFAKAFWMAAAGVVSGSFLVYVALRSIP